MGCFPYCVLHHELHNFEISSEFGVEVSRRVRVCC